MARNGFPGGMGGGNMQQLMRQAQKMQQDMTRIQQEISEASVGGGVVSATVLGTKELKAITIDPSCVDPDDVEMLQDLIISAVNEAMRSAEETMNSEMNKVTGGMKLGF